MQPVTIAPFQTGLNTDLERWLIPPDAFTLAQNVHIRHGVVEKREGYRLFGRVKDFEYAIAITNISQDTNAVVTTDGAHLLSTDDIVYIHDVGGMDEVNDNFYTITALTSNTFALNINSSTFSAYTSGGSVRRVTDSTNRVMGIHRYIKQDGAKTTLAFDTERACRYDTVLNQFLPLDTSPVLDCGDTDYIWATNLQSSNIPNRLYFSNGKPYNGTTDGIRYYNESGNSTVGFRPDLGGGRELYGAKLLFSLRERLLAIGTYEFDGTNVNYHPQRVRWCQAQNPDNWNDLTPGGGGFVDASTGDQVISARDLKDYIIVFFTDSVWTIAPISDPSLPFVWQKVNSYKACNGKMATIGYDRYAVALGTRGITASDATETRRVDERIENFCFDQINTSQFDKVFGLRSFANRRTWMLYPSVEEEENNSVLIFDEDSGAYTTYTMPMNCLGYSNLGKDFALEDFTAANNLDLALEDFAEDTLQSYFWQDEQEILLGGSIDGNVYQLETDGTDNEEPIAMVIDSASWNPFKQQGVESLLSYVDFYVDTDQKTTAVIEFFKDDETAPYAFQYLDCLPNLGFISDIQGIEKGSTTVVVAPGHGLKTGDTVYIYGTSGMDEINGGPYSVTAVNPNRLSINMDSTAYGSYTTGGALYEKPFYKTKVWKRAYCGAAGYEHRIRISSIGSDAPLILSAIKAYYKPRGKRTVQ